MTAQKRYTIGIDVGTTGTKVVLLDPDGALLAQEGRDCELFSQRSGFAEADPGQWLNNIASAIPVLLKTAGVAPAEIAAIATTGMVPALVLVDGERRAVRRAILQNDARATAQLSELGEAYRGLDVVGTTGSALTQQSIAPTLMWLREHEPDALRKAEIVMGSYDWVLYSLGAEAHVEQNWALESGLFEIDGRFFSPAFEHARIEPELVPPPRSPGTVVGELSANGARLTGLVAGVQLVVGGADHVLSAFAAGVDEAGSFLVKLGGAGDILAASNTPVVDPRLYLDAHPVPGLWLPNGCMATSGSLIRWYQSLVGGAELMRLDAEAAEREPAEILCLPYFLGEKSPLHDPDLRGAFIGMHLGHTRADLYRSVLEGIAFGFRHHVEVFAEIGMPVHRAMVTNGGSKSVLWKQIHADVLGIPMHPVLDHPGASLGAAIIAAIGAGVLPDWAAASRFLQLGPVVEPNPDTLDRYSDAYAEWRRSADVLTPVSHHLSRRALS
ncbi:carbohydrate kinase [Leucobacter sp. CSA1]|uniref:Carbohydrate kinase n=1 Tax=Leucobacter chromiisoli TaxID=2796471 RepID=A0A934UUT8_9MICO|nr:FGGY family carbohydrate kinase [Leucobacter chromiisoli]MBK0418776.1 carbohydrate kinase [Leucobacter chromiisoli]